jgi:hypothetical protein
MSGFGLDEPVASANISQPMTNGVGGNGKADVMTADAFSMALRPMLNNLLYNSLFYWLAEVVGLASFLFSPTDPVWLYSVKLALYVQVVQMLQSRARMLFPGLIL